MKKLFKVVALSAAMAMGFSTLAACGGNKGNGGNGGNGGTISGSYKPVDVTDEATIEKINDEVAKINMNSVLGDMTAENWMFGVDGNIALDVLLQEDNEYIKANGTIELGASVQADGQTPVIGAKVTGKANVNITKNFAKELKIEDALNANATFNAYADMEYVYLDQKVTGIANLNDGVNEAALKVKYATMDLIEMVMGGVKGMNAESEVEGGEAQAFDIATLVAMAKQYGVEVSVDVSNGLKVKAAATANTLDTLLAMIPGGDEGTVISQIVNKDNVKNFVVEVYVAFDKNGGFEAFAAKIDVKVQYTGVSTFDSTKQSNNVVSLKLTANVKKSTKTVTVPDSVKNDTSYVEESFGGEPGQGGVEGGEQEAA